MLKTPPVLRDIVRDAAILAGRWHLAGTNFAIVEIKADYQATHAANGAVNGSYRYMDVTAEELASVLAFDFPMIRETRVQHLQGAFVVECECGEDTPAFLGDLRTEAVRCICGREWWIRMYAEPKIGS